MRCLFFLLVLLPGCAHETILRIEWIERENAGRHPPAGLYEGSPRHAPHPTSIARPAPQCVCVPGQGRPARLDHPCAGSTHGTVRPAGRCRWMRTSSSVVSCSTSCHAVSTRFATTACGHRRTGRCCDVSAMSLRSIKPTWPCEIRLNRNHPNPLEAYGPVKVSPAHTVGRVCWSGLPPSRGRPERRHLVAVDLPTSGDPDHAAPWLRFLVVVCLRLRSNSAAAEASGASHSPRVRPGSPHGERAQPRLAAPSALLITCPTEDAPR